VEATSYVELSRTSVTAVGMHVQTGGDVQRSRRVRELVQSSLGCTDELRVLASGGRQVWGGMALFRDDPAAPYTPEDVAFVSSLSALLARGLRVGLLARLAAAPPPSAQTGPAVMVFSPDGELIQASVGAEERLAHLVHGDGAPFPSAVIGSLVAGAWRYATGATDVLPSSRVRLDTGEWVVLHASPLTATDGSTTGVCHHPRGGAPTGDRALGRRSFDLTTREREVTRMVLQGVDTREIADTLHMSRHTVQDHLKAIFNNTGVSTRRELVAHVFFDQYVPRLGNAVAPSGAFIDAPSE
jgi:DNA-binding CsgD family transcriptional regulator